MDNLPKDFQNSQLNMTLKICIKNWNVKKSKNNYPEPYLKFRNGFFPNCELDGVTVKKG